MNYYTDVLKKYAIFNGRAGRKEYWLFMLFNCLIAWTLFIILSVVGSFTGLSWLKYFTYIYTLAILIPGLAVTVRRLHDTNHSAWRLLWVFLVPIASEIVMFTSAPLLILMSLILMSWAVSLVVIGVLIVLNLFVGLSLLIFLCLNSSPVENKYGPIPQKTVSSPRQHMSIAVLIIIAIILAGVVGYLNYKSFSFSNSQMPKDYSKVLPVDCVKLGTNFEKTACIEESAKQRDLSVCDNISKSVNCMDDAISLDQTFDANRTIPCWQKCQDVINTSKAFDAVTFKYKDPAPCAAINEIYVKGFCYSHAAYDTNNYLICANIPSELKNTKNDCYLGLIGQNYKDINLLKQICPFLNPPLPTQNSGFSTYCSSYYLGTVPKTTTTATNTITPTITPTLSITAPNSGIFGMNDQIVIKWTTNIPPNISVTINVQSQDSKVFCQLPYIIQQTTGPGLYFYVPANTACINDSQAVPEKIVPGIYRINMSVSGQEGSTKDALGGWFTIK